MPHNSRQSVEVTGFCYDFYFSSWPTWQWRGSRPRWSLTRRHSVIFHNIFSSVTNEMQGYTVYFCEMLYMFQAVPPPIIRSSKMYIQHRVFCQIFTATCQSRGRDGTPSVQFSTCFRWVPPPIIRSSKTVYTASGTLSNLYCYLPLSSSNSSATVAGSSKVLTKYPMLYIQFLSSWWWAEEPPEICNAFHRNK